MSVNEQSHDGGYPDLEGEWIAAQVIYPLYCALARECVIDALPCPDIENISLENISPASLDASRKWFAEMDERIEVHQLRHFLQTTALATLPAIEALLLHHVRKPKRSDSDRNKLDFLLVQFFSLHAPPHLKESELDLLSVAQTLAPVLGRCDLVIPERLEAFQELTAKSEACRTLKELFTSRIIEQGRKLKESCGDDFFLPISMVVVTQFGFLLRRNFFRLMQQDLNAILDGLRELETRGVENLDCRKAQFSAYEPVSRLRMICQSWKVMFHAEYSAGQPLCLLVDLRTVIDAALVKTRSKEKEKDSVPAKSHATAAGAGSGSAGWQEFNVVNHDAAHVQDGESKKKIDE